jgi:tetratricopeptide (TPR) repeat protein
MPSAFRASLLILLLLSVSETLSQAGVYHSSESVPISVDSGGYAAALTFYPDNSGAFPQRLTQLMNALDANPARAANPDRQERLDRIARVSGAELSPTQIADLGADLLRVGRVDDALNRLAPRSRDRQPDYFILMNLAHIYATRGEWHEAIRWHQAAFLDAPFPDSFATTTPEQRHWLKRLERIYYARWLQLHRDRAAIRLDPAQEDVFPLFQGIRFVNAQGEYHPGTVSADSQAKLPPDAIAIVQQLLLWAPWDTSLYWLLAELYAAQGQLRLANLIFDQCAGSRQYSNRRILMAHRAAVREAVALLPPETDPLDAVALPTANLSQPSQPENDDFLPSREKVILVSLGFALFFLLLIGLQLRSLARRRKKTHRPLTGGDTTVPHPPA